MIGSCQKNMIHSDKTTLPTSGIDTRYPQLAKVVERAFDGVTHAKKPGTVTTSVLVIKVRPNGAQLMAERYREGFGIYSGYRTWSTTKSITAALMGIASQQGMLKLDQPAAIPEWPEGDPRRAITYQQLMWMSSGLYSGGPNSAAVYFGGQDVISAATGTPLEVAPGTRWQYSGLAGFELLAAGAAALAGLSFRGTSPVPACNSSSSAGLIVSRSQPASSVISPLLRKDAPITTVLMP